MTPKFTKHLILSLLLDDLIHAKLLAGLAALNFKPDDYYIDLADKIITLLGFRGKRNELAYEYYMERRKQSQGVNLSDGNKEMQKLAELIYKELRELKRKG